MKTNVIIDGDACPVVNSVIELTKGTGIFVTILRSFSHFSQQIQPEHVKIVYVDDGPDAVDYKIVELASNNDIVITQDYGLASLLIDKVHTVMHHKGNIYHSNNIQSLLNQRYLNAQIRRRGGRHKGPPPFTTEDRLKYRRHIMKRIAVYCGASKGKNPSYVKEAYELGKYMAEQGYELVFGAGSVGIMGAIQDGILEHGGKAIGVMPKMLDEREITSQKVSELILVDSMHERKNKMTELADAFIMAPGGAGSLEEFFEMYSWAQIGIHQKPIGVFNLNGFFEPLQHLIDHMIKEGFIDEKYQKLAPLYDTKESLIEGLKHYKPLGVRTYD